MKRFVFGFDTDHPERCALNLREKGFDAVVLGSADLRTEEALASRGWNCTYALERCP